MRPENNQNNGVRDARVFLGFELCQHDILCGLCTSVLRWQAAEEGGHEDLEFRPELRTVSYTLSN